MSRTKREWRSVNLQASGGADGGHHLLGSRTPKVTGPDDAARGGEGLDRVYAPHRESIEGLGSRPIDLAAAVVIFLRDGYDTPEFGAMAS